jgi:hypothetical protein
MGKKNENKKKTLNKMAINPVLSHTYNCQYIFKVVISTVLDHESIRNLYITFVSIIFRHDKSYLVIVIN